MLHLEYRESLVSFFSILPGVHSLAQPVSTGNVLLGLLISRAFRGHRVDHEKNVPYKVF